MQPKPIEDLELAASIAGIDPNDADPDRVCPACQRSGRESRYVVMKGMVIEQPPTSTEYRFLLACSNPICLHFSLLRKGVERQVEPEPIMEV